MQVYKRDPGGVWYVRWTDYTGRMRRTSARTRDHTAAQAYGVRLETRNETNHGNDDQTLSQFLNEQYVEMVSNKTLAQDVIRFDHHIQPFLGEAILAGISIRDCQRLQVAVRKRLGDASTNRVMSLLSAMMTQAIRWGYRDGLNPCHAVKALPEGPDVRKILGKDDEVLLMAHLKQPMVSYITLALNTGLRRGELLALEWIDFTGPNPGGSRSWFAVRSSKSGSPRSIPCNAQAYRAVMSLAPTDSAFLFDGMRSSVNYLLTQACKKAEIPHYRIHDMRHTFCTRLARSGVDVSTIMRLAGHRKLATTLRYLEPKSGAEAVDLL